MATPDREAVLDDIAKTIRGVTKVALVVGSESAVMVRAHEPTNMVFIESHLWPPHPDIRDRFALEIQGRKWAVSPADVAKEQATINQVRLGEREPLTHFELMEKCLSATREKRSEVPLDHIAFKLAHLQWMLDRSPSDLNLVKRMLLVATLPGLFGEYRVYLRATYHEKWELPLHLAVAAALDEGELGDV